MSQVILQYIINQRGEVPTGQRLLDDGSVQRAAANNPQPTETERLDLDRELTWETTGQISTEQLSTISAAVAESGFFDLEPKLLINYCKEDPGTGIWTVNVGGRSHHVVVFDPRPRRSAVIDKLVALLKEITPA
jgi:hypothetical protein